MASIHTHAPILAETGVTVDLLYKTIVPSTISIGASHGFILYLTLGYQELRRGGTDLKQCAPTSAIMNASFVFLGSVHKSAASGYVNVGGHCCF